MYYYIIEPPLNFNLPPFQQKLRAILDDLNINGEIALASPARSAEEIARMGLDKGYSTIVAIGGASLVNRLASLIAKTEAALGVIPLRLSAEIGNLFGGLNLKQACQTIAKRQIATIDLGHIAPSKYFLSDLIIQPPAPTPISINVDGRYELKANITKMIISSNLAVSLETEPASQSPTFWRRFKNQPNNTNQSLFQAQSLQLFTPEPTNMVVCGTVVAKTPADITREPKVLKIISSRDTIG